LSFPDDRLVTPGERDPAGRAREGGPGASSRSGLSGFAFPSASVLLRLLDSLSSKPASAVFSPGMTKKKSAPLAVNVPRDKSALSKMTVLHTNLKTTVLVLNSRLEN
jgi:hypothetical protein